MSDEEKVDQSRHEDKSLQEPSLIEVSENSEYLLNEEQTEQTVDKRSPGTLTGCLKIIVLSAIFVPLALYLALNFVCFVVGGH